MSKQGARAHYNQVVPWIVYLSSNQLPSRSGHHYALDAAVSCTVSGIRELLKNGRARDDNTPYYIGQPKTTLTRSYSSAVAALRYSLGDTQQSSSPEVLLAALLLCCFEV